MRELNLWRKWSWTASTNVLALTMLRHLCSSGEPKVIHVSEEGTNHFLPHVRQLLYAWSAVSHCMQCRDISAYEVDNPLVRTFQHRLDNAITFFRHKVACFPQHFILHYAELSLE